MELLRYKTTNLLFILLIVFSVSCSTSGEDANLLNEQQANDSLLMQDSLGNENIDKTIRIYYNVPSPLEMATLVRRDNASFYTDLLSSTENLDRFMTNSSVALNVGVYGVDLSYAKIFKQEQTWRKYLTAVRELSNKLDIPEDQTASVYGSIEENIENTDSLLNIINDTYVAADNYLRTNDRESTATLIVLGGWIEALYIAINIYEREDNSEDILNRILVQKFSLNYLVERVSKSQNDPTVAKFLETLQLLRKVYEGVEIKYNKEDIAVDSLNKVMIISSEKTIYASEETLKDISSIVTLLRNLITK